MNLPFVPQDSLIGSMPADIELPKCQLYVLLPVEADLQKAHDALQQHLGPAEFARLLQVDNDGCSVPSREHAPTPMQPAQAVLSRACMAQSSEGNKEQAALRTDVGRPGESCSTQPAAMQAVDSLPEQVVMPCTMQGSKEALQPVDELQAVSPGRSSKPNGAHRGKCVIKLGVNKNSQVAAPPEQSGDGGCNVQGRKDASEVGQANHGMHKQHRAVQDDAAKLSYEAGPPDQLGEAGKGLRIEHADERAAELGVGQTSREAGTSQQTEKEGLAVEETEAASGLDLMSWYTGVTCCASTPCWAATAVPADALLKQQQQQNAASSHVQTLTDRRGCSDSRRGRGKGSRGRRGMGRGGANASAGAAACGQVAKAGYGKKASKKRAGRLVRELAATDAANEQGILEVGYFAHIKQFEVAQRRQGHSSGHGQQPKQGLAYSLRSGVTSDVRNKQ
jgi:hypothetical protein